MIERLFRVSGLSSFLKKKERERRVGVGGELKGERERCVINLLKKKMSGSDWDDGRS